MITTQDIAHGFLKAFSGQVKRKAVTPGELQTGANGEMTIDESLLMQTTIDVCITRKEAQWPLCEILERMIVPAAFSMAREIYGEDFNLGEKLVFLSLNQVKDYDSCTKKQHGFAVRVMQYFKNGLRHYRIDMLYADVERYLH